MKKRIFAAVLTAAMMLCSFPMTAFAAEPTDITGYPVGEMAGIADQTLETTVPTEEEAYSKIMAMKSSYPEGMTWTNANYYGWKGGIYTGGYGCAGFAFLMSDAAFGDLPAKMYYSFDYETIKVGDILRVNNNGHSVIVLEIHSDYVVVAEGNYNSMIHWGRKISKSVVMSESTTYMMTRYPCLHSYTKTVVSPTCTSQGYTLYTCENCGDSYKSDYVAATGHSWDSGAVTTAATCTSSGVKTYTCKTCGTTKTETVDRKDHSYGDVVFTWASDHASCKASMTCASCKNTLTANCTVTKSETLVQYIYKATVTLNGTSYTDTVKVTKKVYERFSDVSKSAWYVDYIQYVFDKGLMDGVSNTEFQPNAPLSRAMVAQILYANAGKPSVSGNNPFTDVKSSAWYHNAVVWAYKKGIVSGTSATTFSPNANITREQFAVILYAHAGRPKPTGNLAEFKDVNKVSAWAIDAMIWAYSNGVISGIEQDGSRYLNPQGLTTRAQAATMLMKYLEG